MPPIWAMSLYPIVTFRVILLIVILIVYLYAVGYNLYLRTVSVVIISLLFALLWSDLETFIFIPWVA